STVVLGKAIEIYHFRDVFMRMVSLSILILALISLEVLVTSRRRASDGLSQRFAILSSAWVPLALLIAAGYLIVFPTYQRLQKADHMRPEYPEWQSLKGYRADFVSLVKELTGPDYSEEKVLGTFDHQLWSWWLTFNDGYSYVSDSLITTLSTSERETRLIMF